MSKRTGKSVAKRVKPKSTVNKKVPAKSSKTATKPVAVGPKDAAAQAPSESTRPKRLPNAWTLTKLAANTLWEHRVMLGGLTLIYGLLNLILVQGFAAGSDVATLKTNFNQVFHGDAGPLLSSVGIFAVLVGSAGNSGNDTAGAYQLFLGLINSLAIIWALRQLLAGKKLRWRDAYYEGMYPLVQFVAVLGIIYLQLLPFIVGAFLYGTVLGNGLAVGFIEKAGWGLLYGGLAAVSLYMISATVFALYIVTLPDMTPRKAVRSAKKLVKGHRLYIFRKMLFLPLVLLVVAAVVMVPLIILVTPLAQWVFFFFTMFTMTAFHTYTYTLYRELLNE